MPRAELLLKLYPNPEVKRIVVEVYTQILRFLLRALGWYQESKFKHILGSITRPAELRYDDVLEKITALSNSLFWISSASSQAEQRDIHTTIKQQTQRQIQQNLSYQFSFDQLKELIKQVDDRSSQTHAIVLQMKESIASVAAEQVIHSSAQIGLRQQLSQVQLVQFLDQLGKTPLSDPIKGFRKALSLHKFSMTKLGPQATPFWLNPKIQEWNTSQECSLIILKGAWDKQRQIRGFCVESIASLLDSQIPVIWALKSNATLPETTEATTGMEPSSKEISTIDLIKFFISQAVAINKTVHTDAILSPWLNAYLGAKTEEEWLNLLVSVLDGIPLLYIILDLDILSFSLTSQDKDFWPPACQRIFSALSARRIATVLRVVLVNYRPMLSQRLSSELEGMVVCAGASSRQVSRIKAGQSRLSGRGKVLGMIGRGGRGGMTRRGLV